MTLEDIDKELARLPATPKTDDDLNARAALMARRIEIDQAAKVVRDAASGRQPARGGIQVTIPDGLGLSHFFGTNGRVATARVAEDGRRVLDLFVHEFRTLLGDRQYGLDWHNCNPEALRQLAELS